MRGELGATSTTAKYWRSSISWGVMSCVSASLGYVMLIVFDINAAFGQPATTPSSPAPISTTGSNRPTLTPGSRGAEVSELQATLKLLGYYAGTVDGVYGQTTVAAVTQFQQIAGLNADGIAGPATWNRLFPATPELPDAPAATIANRPTSQGTPAQLSSGFPIPSSVSSGGVTGTPSPTPRSTAPAATAAPLPSSAPASVAPILFPVLRLGAKGPAVIGLQDRLRAIGFYKGTSDGVFGPETQTAVKAAQRKFNLDPDGVVGSATWTVLLR